ncbi:MAG: L,D-transpeptidase family protein [Lachnospiraceae bacterium]|nr:L,D-transpeptidase family protein [Lachnospiraceae bacterium]
MKKRSRRLLSCCMVLVSAIGLSAWQRTVYAAEEVKPASVIYRTHVQTYGWQDWRADGMSAGTSNESKRLEAIEIRLESSYSGSVAYRTHVQTYGWQDWRADGVPAGTSNESKRLEAIEINLTGEISEYYDIEYRTHVQTYGWMDWKSNGELSGTVGESKRLEAIEIRLVPKDGQEDEDTSYVQPDNVGYSVHVQSYGWQEEVEGGEAAGTVGESKRLEAIQIALKKSGGVSGGIEYRTHVQSYGWMNWVEEGGISGTSNESKRLEAIQIRLTGKMAEVYDIYYRVHAQSYGWLGWARNGQPAGTAGYSKRLEAIEIVLRKKGEAAPGAVSDYYRFRAVDNLMETVSEVRGASQVITVVGDGTPTGAKLSLWIKNGDSWQKQLDTAAVIGRNGFSDHTFEGDKTTPTGIYELGVAFGNKANPGTALRWFDVNPYHYWIDDLNSVYYNQLIDSREIPGGWSSGEHLSRYIPDYNYSVNIEVNPQCRKDSTSAIFLHCLGRGPYPYTSGCVAIGEEQMRTVLQLLNPGARILIVQNIEDLLNYVDN